MKQAQRGKWRAPLLLAAAVSALLAACDVLGPGADLRVTVTPREVTLAVGDTAVVTYSVTNPRGGATYARLESKSPTIAGVREPDRIFGISPGSAWVVVAAWADAGLTGRDSVRVLVQ